MAISDAVRLSTTGQNITSTGTSSASTAFAAFTTKILVTASAAVNVRIAEGTPTAVATDTLLAANTPYVFIVSPGQKLSSIGTATVNITELV